MQKLVIGMLRCYKRWISPLLPSACRFYPTCSEYMLQAVELYGVPRGIYLGTRRLLRCHPFHEGGFDPVCSPETLERSSRTKQPELSNSSAAGRSAVSG